jgi:hypothetical protein
MHNNKYLIDVDNNRLKDFCKLYQLSTQIYIIIYNNNLRLPKGRALGYNDIMYTNY